MRSHEKGILAAGAGRAGKCRHGGDPGARGRHAAPGEQAGALMDKLNIVEGRAYPFGMKNVDTDIVIPAHWLKTISRAGLGRGAFEVLRKEPGNVFDDPAYAGSPNLLAEIGRASGRERR